MISLTYYTPTNVLLYCKGKGKAVRYRPGVPQRAPGS